MYNIKVEGGGTKEDIAQALTLIAAQLRNDTPDEDLLGAQFNDCTLEVTRFTKY
jgi:hypothetical protein